MSNELKQNTEGQLQLTLFVDEINFILNALSKMQFDQVHLLVAKIQHQAVAQLQLPPPPPQDLPPPDMH